MEIYFDIENTRTWMQGASPYLLKYLDEQLRHATPLAYALEQGFVPPEAEVTWDGWLRFLHTPKTMPAWFPTGLLPLVMHHCSYWGWQCVLRDHRYRPESGMPELVNIPLRDYQEAAVAAGEKWGRGVFVMPPRAGKTRTGMELQRRIALPAVWIAPTDGIIRQTLVQYDKFFGKNYAVHLQGSANWDGVKHVPVVLCTAALAVRLPLEFYQTRQMLLVDEWHHAAAKSYKIIFDMCSHIFYLFGMTGTHKRSGVDEMSMHALLSRVLYQVTSTELLRRGFIVPAYVCFLPSGAKRLRGVSGGFIEGHGKAGVHENAARNRLVARAAKYLLEQGRKPLVLVGTKEQGRLIKALLEVQVPASPRGAEFSSVEFVHSVVGKARTRLERVISSFLEEQEVKILIGTTVLGEGRDLPVADALVYARGESAEVSLLQAAYRVSTATEGKKSAVIVDFGDKHHKKLFEHSGERLEIFFAEPTFQVAVFQDVEQFFQ